MKRLIEKIIPSDPPMPPMNLTREPIVNRFWSTGLVGLFLGFLLGFMLWLWQQGIVEAPDNYFSLKSAHARLQILFFAGSFLLGFALQAGPHVIGGPPPPSKKILAYLPFLWVGTGLSLTSDPGLVFVGKLMVSASFAGPATLLLGITLKGLDQFRIPRGIPLASSFGMLSIAPWLTLDDPDVALFVIWCGPVTAALVAAQQLTNNVLGGKLLQGVEAKFFAAALYMAWLTTAAAAFLESGSWTLSGLFWLAVLAIQVRGTNFLSAALNYRFSGIQVTLLLAFAGVAASALMPILAGEDFMTDSAVHLLGAGVITLLVLGVAARVAGFFSGKAVMPDRGIIYILFGWSLLAIVRTLTPLGWGSPGWILGTLHLGLLILLLWSIPMANRLNKIGQQFHNH
ncbi:MAG: NnrS family protein [Magnetococcales bacterium]|nr:NnrS family protein [Magnetococcales bacterium]